MRQIPDGWTGANLAMHDKFAVTLRHILKGLSQEMDSFLNAV
jgi:hypothetical protein